MIGSIVRTVLHGLAGVAILAMTSGCATKGQRVRGNSDIVSARILNPKKVWYQLQTAEGRFVAAGYTRKHGIRFVLPEVPPEGATCMKIVDEYGEPLRLRGKSRFSNPAWWEAARQREAEALDGQARALASWVVEVGSDPHAGFPETELLLPQCRARLESLPEPVAETEQSKPDDGPKRPPELPGCGGTELEPLQVRSSTCVAGTIVEDLPDGPVVVLGDPTVASGVRLAQGDRILAVDGTLVTNTHELARALEEVGPSFQIIVERLRQPVTVTLAVDEDDSADRCPNERQPLSTPPVAFTNGWVRRGSMLYMRVGAALNEFSGEASILPVFGALHQEIGFRWGAWIDHPSYQPVVEVSALFTENFSELDVTFGRDFTSDVEIGGRFGLGLRFVMDSRLSFTTVPYAAYGTVLDQTSIPEPGWAAAGLDIGFNRMGALGWGIVGRAEGRRRFQSFGDGDGRTSFSLTANLEATFPYRGAYARRMKKKAERRASR